MTRFIRRFWKDTQGQDLVEYALAAGMVALAAVAAMPQLSGTINNVFSIDPEGITRAWPSVPLISMNARITQNHAIISLFTRELMGT